MKQCPYCWKVLSEENAACCGEVGHGVEPTEADWADYGEHLAEKDRLIESLLPIARMAKEASTLDVNDLVGRIKLVVLLSTMAGLANVALERAKTREVA